MFHQWEGQKGEIEIKIQNGCVKLGTVPPTDFARLALPSDFSWLVPD